MEEDDEYSDDPTTETEDEQTPKPKKKSVRDDLARANGCKQPKDFDRYQLTIMQQGAEQADQRQLPPIEPSRDFDRAFQSPTRESKSQGTGGAPTPVRLEVDSSGNLVLVSLDPDALDQLENLMLQISPPKRPYQVFHIEHATAFWMRLNLEDYFEDAKDSDSSEANEFYR